MSRNGLPDDSVADLFEYDAVNHDPKLAGIISAEQGTWTPGRALQSDDGRFLDAFDGRGDDVRDLKCVRLEAGGWSGAAKKRVVDIDVDLWTLGGWWSGTGVQPHREGPGLAAHRRYEHGRPVGSPSERDVTACLGFLLVEPPYIQVIHVSRI